jgi:hypothetical protein
MGGKIAGAPVVPNKAGNDPDFLACLRLSGDPV